MAELLSGKVVAAAIRTELAARITQLGFAPRLALLRVGDHPDDLAYIRSIERQCAALGIETEHFALPLGSTTGELLRAADAINMRRDLHGCLLLRPLPEQIDEAAVCDALAPEKDIDGMSSRSLGALFVGDRTAFAPCTAQACIELLDYYHLPIAGLHAVVLGRSLVVGRPLGQLLLQRDATVTVCHSETRDLASLCRGADLLISAVGQPGLVNAGYLRAGQIVLDVGTTMQGDRLLGDVNAADAEALVRAWSPVPGGVGAVTTAVLLRNLVTAAERAVKRR